MCDFEIKANAPLLFDTHAHYDDYKFEPDRDTLVASLPENGIGWALDVGCSLDSIPKARMLAEKYDHIYCSAGMHPNDAQIAEDTEGIIEFLKENLKYEKNRAIGEIGLDYHYDDVPREIQKKWFEIQLDLAEELNKPVIVHDREAHGDCLDIIKNHKKVKGIVHSFSGSPEMATELIKLGWYISFSGVLTFKNAAKLPEVAKIVPSEFMLVETDCPYLAPTPHRGERNSSILMKHTASKLAEIRGISYEEVCEITTKNAKRIYNLK